MMEKTIAGKTIMVTGSTDGLGKKLAENLVRLDAVLILHGKNPDKGEKLTHELYAHNNNGRFSYYNGDYASLRAVSELAETIMARYDHIDVLINNVGIGSGDNKRQLSEDGLELRFQVNYLSHVLLTERLLALIKPGGVIINVASIGQEPLDFTNMMLEKNYDGFHAYKHSKTALIMYTVDLAERLKTKEIMVNAIHPASLMNTKMVMDYWGYTLSTVEQGADAVQHLILMKTTGMFYSGKTPSRAIAQVYDSQVRTALADYTWQILKQAHASR